MVATLVLFQDTQRRYTSEPSIGPGGVFRDREKALADYVPAAEFPDTDTIRAALVVPEVPEELPAVADLLKRLSLEPIDPWALPLPAEPSQESSV